jgi:hypothetical protein
MRAQPSRIFMPRLGVAHPRQGDDEPVAGCFRNSARCVCRSVESFESESTHVKTTEGKEDRILTTAADMREAIKAARQREKTATKIREAHYNRRSDAIVADLSTGATLIIPRPSVPGFAKATARELRDPAITPGGEGLWSDTVDDGVLLEQLLVLAVGEAALGTIGARINAAKCSPARASASRANGQKGGRPRKSAA